jgi:hypothetical protein
MTAPAFAVLPSSTHVFSYCESYTSAGVKTPSTPANGFYMYAAAACTVNLRIDGVDAASEMQVVLAPGQNIFLPYIKIREINIATYGAGSRISLLW